MAEPKNGEKGFIESIMKRYRKNKKKEEKIVVKPVFTKKDMEEYTKDKKKEAKKEEKVLTCPHCGSDLRKVGFATFEEATEEYEWKFSKKDGYFNSKLYNSESNGGVDRVECGKCGEELDWGELHDIGVV